MRIKIWLMGALALSLLLFPQINQAQSPDCGTLNPEDCEAFSSALIAFGAREGFRAENLKIQFGGSEGQTSENISLNGSGVFGMAEGRISAAKLALTATDSTGTSDGQIIWLDEQVYIGETDEAGSLTWSGADLSEGQNRLILELLSGNLFIEALSGVGATQTSRIDDAELNDQTMQVFLSEVNIAPLLANPRIVELFGIVLALGDDAELSQAQSSELQGALQLLPFLMTRDDIFIRFWVGAEDGELHHFEIVVDVALNAAMIDPSIGEAAIAFNLSADLYPPPSTLDIVAPRGDIELIQDPLSVLGAALDEMLASGGGLGMGSGPSEPEPLSAEFDINYGDAVSGTLSASNSQDVYAFQASAGDVITISMRATAERSSLDTRLFLYNSTGEQIAYNDDHNNSRSDLELGIFDSLIPEFEIPAEGEYLIVATWLTETRDGDYSLLLEVH